MSIRWNLLDIISLAVTSCLVCADPAGAADLDSGKAFVTSNSGMGGFAGLFSGEAMQPGIAVAAADPGASPETSPISDYFANWFARVDQAKQSQPHWLPPLMTMSPLITELLRQDAYYQWAGNGSRVLNLGAGKGLFLVPWKTIEVDFGIPSFQQRYDVQPAAGLAAQAPIGIPQFTDNAFVITPSIAGGKGFGNLNIQAATSLVIPTAHEDTIGTALRTNVAFQYHLGELLWPEFEVNW